MTSSLWLIFVLVMGIAMIILMTTRLKLHPFLALIVATYGIAFASGLPMTSDDTATVTITKAITQGFGQTMTNIGLIILFGCIIGTILEKSGAAIRLADMIVQVIGKRSPPLAMSMIGYVVSIPVFCDSGFIILSPFRKALAHRTGSSPVVMAIALSTGLYATHVMVPPTPGPIAAAANLDLTGQLFKVIFVGLCVSIPTALIGLVYASWAGQGIKTEDDLSDSDVKKSYQDLINQYDFLPNATLSALPIVLPILLMGLGTLTALFPFPETLSFHHFGNILIFLGTPVNALGIGLISAFFLLPKFNEQTLTHWIGESLKAAAPILVITGTGGSLGYVLQVTQIGETIGTLLSERLSIGIIVPFIISATIKTAQGSSTVAMTATSALVAPLLGNLGLDAEMSKILVVMAIGAGAMTVSHANDSYFWVVTEFTNLKIKDAYKAQTMATLVQGCFAMFIIFIISLFVK